MTLHSSAAIFKKVQSGMFIRLHHLQFISARTLWECTTLSKSAPLISRKNRGACGWVTNCNFKTSSRRRFFETALVLTPPLHQPQTIADIKQDNVYSHGFLVAFPNLATLPAPVAPAHGCARSINATEKGVSLSRVCAILNPMMPAPMITMSASVSRLRSPRSNASKRFLAAHLTSLAAQRRPHIWRNSCESDGAFDESNCANGVWMRSRCLFLKEERGWVD